MTRSIVRETAGVSPVAGGRQIANFKFKLKHLPKFAESDVGPFRSSGTVGPGLRTLSASVRLGTRCLQPSAHTNGSHAVVERMPGPGAGGDRREAANTSPAKQRLTSPLCDSTRQHLPGTSRGAEAGAGAEAMAVATVYDRDCNGSDRRPSLLRRTAGLLLLARKRKQLVCSRPAPEGPVGCCRVMAIAGRRRRAGRRRK